MDRGRPSFASLIPASLSPHLRGRFVALCFASGLAALPETAQAGPLEQFGYGGGIFVGYRFGAVAGRDRQEAMPGKLIYGAELYGSYRFGADSSYASVFCGRSGQRLRIGGVGPALRITRVHRQRTDFSATVMAGGLLATPLAMSVELGAAYSPGQASAMSLVAGTRLDAVFGQVFMRGIWTERALRPEVGGGLISGPQFEGPPYLGTSCSVSVDGRRWHTQDAPSLEEVAELSYGRDATFDHSSAAHKWARQAQIELESIPAFLQLASDLIAAGAPESLVAAALTAAEDELAHAHACTALAQRFGAIDFVPQLAQHALRRPLPGADGVERLIRESWDDGCLEEGAAAVDALWSATHAADPHVAATQHQIAQDEQRHADLAWSVLSWAMAQRATHRKLGRELQHTQKAQRWLSQADAPDVGLPQAYVDQGMIPPAVEMQLRAGLALQATNRICAMSA